MKNLISLILVIFPIFVYSQVGISNTLGFTPSVGTIVDVDGKFKILTVGDAYFIGNVGIGIAPDPSYKLYVSGKLRTNGINETSDIRFKENILLINYALDKIMKINGVTYEWRRDEYPEMNFTTQRQYGIIAQDLQVVVPELVDTDSSGYKSIQYTHIIPILIEAIKEMEAQILKDKADIIILRNEIAKMKPKY